jgi:ferredoxin
MAGILVFLLTAAPAWCQEQKKQEPPAFSSGYRLPTQWNPLPRAEIFSVVDIVVLAAALALTAYLTLTRRSRSGVRVLSIFSLLYFGFYRQGCVCAVGSVQNVALSIFQHGYALPFAVAAFFLLPLAFALFVGRVFCAAVCPLGAIQDIVLLRERRVPEALEHALGLLPYLYLGAAILFAATGTDFIVCRWDPFVGFFRMAGRPDIIAIGAGLLLLSTFIGRPYCRFLCPYGVLLRWLSPLARWKPDVTPSICINCHLCAASCPFGALRVPDATIEPRWAVRRRASILLALLPVIVAVTAWLGFRAGPVLARANPTVSLAHRVWAEEHGLVRGQSLESAGFYALGASRAAMFSQASTITRHFNLGGSLFGAWAGLVIGLKLLSLMRNRAQKFYQADPAACLACGRCYSYCPVGKGTP